MPGPNQSAGEDARTGHTVSFAPRWRRWAMAACLMLVGLLSLPGAPAAGASSAGAAAATAPPILAPIPASRAAQRIAVITIEGEINAVTAKSFIRRMDEAVKGGADCIVIELNTPGGVYKDILEAIENSPVPNTIAWINTNAYSAGTFIALGCREIVLAPNAKMGDAAGIMIGPMGQLMALPATERAKILAPSISDLVNSARRRGYDEKLVQAFTTLGVELWKIRDRQTGQIHFVDESEYRAIFGEIPQRGRPAIASGHVATQSEPQNPEIAQEEFVPAEVPADPMAFRPASPAVQKMGLGTTSETTLSIDVASTRPAFNTQDPARYEFIEYVTDGKTLLTLSEADLRRYGFADPNVTIADDQALKNYTGAQHIVRLDQTWSETLVSFMTQGMSGLIVRGLLIAVFLLALFIEMSMPGVGLPGGIALLALAGLIVPPMLIGASTWWALAMILGGILLVLLEIFVMPGFGIPGILGLVMLFGGLIGTFAGVGQLFPGVGGDGASPLAWAASVVLMAMFIAGVGIFFFIRYTDKFPVAGRLVLADRAVMPGDEEEESMLAAMAPDAPARGPVAVGAVGKSVTPLRPSGSVEFGDKLVDVVSEFGFIEAGILVRAVSVSEYRVAVERIGDPPTMPGAPEAKA